MMLIGSNIVGLHVVFDVTLCRGRLQGSRIHVMTEAVGWCADDRLRHTAESEEEGEVFHDESAETYFTSCLL
jgi:hypothetical protein